MGAHLSRKGSGYFPDNAPEEKCGFTTRYKGKEIGDVTCWRTTEEGTDKCIWHSNTHEKSAFDLHSTSLDIWERLDGSFISNTQRMRPLDGTHRIPDLSNICLRHAEFVDADLSGVNFSESDLSYAYFRNVDLTGADFSGAKLYSADFNNVDLSHSDLSSAEIKFTDISNSNLENCEFEDSVVRRLTLDNVTGANFSGATLLGTDISGFQPVKRIRTDKSKGERYYKERKNTESKEETVERKGKYAVRGQDSIKSTESRGKFQYTGIVHGVLSRLQKSRKKEKQEEDQDFSTENRKTIKTIERIITDLAALLTIKKFIGEGSSQEKEETENKQKGNRG